MPKSKYPKMPEPKKLVNCAECGFLAVRHIETHELVEADKSYRLCGLIPSVGEHNGTPHSIWEIHPICFVGAYNLGLLEILKIQQGQSEIDSVIEVVNERRECNSFTEWHLGLTPKEHKEMQSIKEQREWQEKQRKSDRWWRFWEILAFIIAGAATAFIAAWIGRGSLW